MISRIAGATLVQVVSVTNSGGVAPVGSVDVSPMVSMIDGQGRTSPHGIIHNLPYFRLQGGANAIIIDPVIGDIGIAVFADRDLTAVKSTKAPGPPGSRRRNSMADGLYIGGVLNGAPTQYIEFNGSGVTITAPTVTVNGNLVVTGTATIDGDATIDGEDFIMHRHTGVQTGGSDTGPVA